MGPSDDRDELSIEAFVDLSDEADDRPTDRAEGRRRPGFRTCGSGEMIGVDPVWHTVAVRVEAGLRIAELRSGREYQIDRAEKLALSSTHRRDPVRAIGSEGGPGRMIVCDPIERDPCVEPLHDSGRVEIVDPEERLLEAEVTGNAGNERAAERLVGGRYRPFEPERQRRRGVGHVQALVDAPDTSTRNRPVFRSSPRPACDRTRKRHRPVDEEDPVRSGKSRHVLVEAEPVRVPGHTGDADDVAVSKHHCPRSIHELTARDRRSSSSDAGDPARRSSTSSSASTRTSPGFRTTPSAGRPSRSSRPSPGSGTSARSVALLPGSCPCRWKATLCGIAAARKMRGTATPRSPAQTSTPNTPSG